MPWRIRESCNLCSSSAPEKIDEKQACYEDQIQKNPFFLLALHSLCTPVQCNDGGHMLMTTEKVRCLCRLGGREIVILCGVFGEFRESWKMGILVQVGRDEMIVGTSTVDCDE